MREGGRVREGGREGGLEREGGRGEREGGRKRGGGEEREGTFARLGRRWLNSSNFLQWCYIIISIIGEGGGKNTKNEVGVG